MSRKLIYLLALVGLLGMATIDAGVALGNKNATGVIPVRTNNLVNMFAQKGGGARDYEGKGGASNTHGVHPSRTGKGHTKGRTKVVRTPKTPTKKSTAGVGLVCGKTPRPPACYCESGQRGDGTCWGRTCYRGLGGITIECADINPGKL